MKYINNIKKIFLFLYIINNIKAIYLPSGIKSLNKFLYHSRISKYSEQNIDKICSISDGPNCFFTEKGISLNTANIEENSIGYFPENSTKKLTANLKSSKK